MIRRPTWILLAVFALLVGFAWYWQSRGTTISNDDPTPTPQPKLFTVDVTEVRTFEVSDASGGKYLFEQPTPGEWRLAGEDTPLSSGDAVASQLSQLLNLRVLSTLMPAPDPSATGLGQPLYEVRLATLNGQAYELIVGAKTPTQSGYYVRSQGTVMVVGASAIDGLAGMIFAIQPTPTPELATTPNAMATPAVTAMP
jgi:hypothetical protein